LPPVKWARAVGSQETGKLRVFPETRWYELARGVAGKCLFELRFASLPGEREQMTTLWREKVGYREARIGACPCVDQQVVEAEQWGVGSGATYDCLKIGRRSQDGCCCDMQGWRHHGCQLGSEESGLPAFGVPEQGDLTVRVGEGEIVGSERGVEHVCPGCLAQ